MPGPDSPDWSGAPVTTAQPATSTLITATSAGASTIIIPAGAGRQIVVTAVALVGRGLGPGYLRGLVFGIVGYNVLDDDEIITYLAISPAQPAYNAVLAPQAAEVPAGEDVIAQLLSEPGAGSQYCQLTAIYYLI